MQRIYLPHTKFLDVLEITEKELYHQLTRVLRARLWQEVVFFDWENLEDHVYTMIHIDKKSVSFKRKEVIAKKSELQNSLSLYQACPNKLSKFETIVQKCCEVGYSEIIFFESERSQKLVISENKKERLRKIAIESVELCGWNVIPKILFLDSSSTALKSMKEWKILFCHTQSDNSIILGDIPTADHYDIVIGPEWGLSDLEVQGLESNGWLRIYFWERILRCETAGEVAWFYISQKKES